MVSLFPFPSYSWEAASSFNKTCFLSNSPFLFLCAVIVTRSNPPPESAGNWKRDRFGAAAERNVESTNLYIRLLKGVKR